MDYALSAESVIKRKHKDYFLTGDVNDIQMYTRLKYLYILNAVRCPYVRNVRL